MQHSGNEIAPYIGEFCARTTSSNSDRAFWLGITGIPASGKSTVSRELVRLIGDIAIAIPMDGYHLRKSQLDAMPNPSEAHARRGAPFTFDAERFVTDLTTARNAGNGTFPSFQHGVGDPIENDIQLDGKRHRVVIVEGNYLLLNDAPWNGLREVFDETWYLDTPMETAQARLIDRFLAKGLSLSEAEARVAYNDSKNAALIANECKPNADRILPSA